MKDWIKRLLHKPAPVARTWEIPAKDRPRILRGLDKIGHAAGYQARYDFWEDVAEAVPETRGVTCVIDFHGAVPYVREVV